MNRYYAFMAIGAVANALKGIVYATVLDAEAFGYYSLISTLALYTFYACGLGILEGLTLELPALYVNKRLEQAWLWTRRTSRRLLAIGSALAAGGAAWAFLAGGESFFFLAALTALSSTLFSAYITQRRSAGDYSGFGFAVAIRGLLAIALGTAGAIWGGYLGAVVGELVGMLLILCWLTVRFRAEMPRQAGPAPSPREPIGYLYRKGFHAFRNYLTQMLLQTMERWFVLNALGIAAFGQYSFALLFFSAASVAHGIVNGHVGPETLRLYARTNSVDSCYRFVLRYVLWLTGLSIVAAGGILVTMEYLANNVFVDYRSGIALLPIVLLASYFQLTHLFEFALLAVGRAAWLANMSAVVLVACVGLLLVVNATAPSVTAFAIVFLSTRVAIWLVSLLGVRYSRAEEARVRT